MPVTTPVEDTVATLWSELAHVACEVMSAVEPSVEIAVAVNCCVEPTTKLATTPRETAIEEIVGDVEGMDTTRLRGALVTPYNDAVMFVLPAELAVAEPWAEIVAIAGAELAHFEYKVASSCELSEKVAIAVNCCVPFTCKFKGDFCSITTDFIVSTGNVAGAEVIPDKVAVICVLPSVTAVISPLLETVATVGLELFQVTSAVISRVELSEYFPVAVNCWVVPS